MASALPLPNCIKLCLSKSSSVQRTLGQTLGQPSPNKKREPMTARAEPEAVLTLPVGGPVLARRQIIMKY
jgi:hypothetical protein